MGSLSVHVLDEDQSPVSGKKVTCMFPSRYTHSEEYTDDDGTAEFDDVPWGTTIEVWLNGELQVKTSLDGSEAVKKLFAGDRQSIMNMRS